MKICCASSSQCPRTANSPLFSSVSSIETIRSSVIALGARRLREILWSSFLVRMTVKAKWPLEPQAFWEHSLGCALIRRRLAADIGL
jgi:HD-like signal output (HDOD) protein